MTWVAVLAIMLVVLAIIGKLGARKRASQSAALRRRADELASCQYRDRSE